MQLCSVAMKVLFADSQGRGHIVPMAQLHVTRVKREFREIITSEEVSSIACNSPNRALVYFLNRAHMCR